MRVNQDHLFDALFLSKYVVVQRMHNYGQIELRIKIRRIRIKINI